MAGSYTFKLGVRLNFTKAFAVPAARFADRQGPRGIPAPLRAMMRRQPAGLPASRRISAPGQARCRPCKEAIAKQPVPRQAMNLYSFLNHPRQRQDHFRMSGGAAAMIDAVAKPKNKAKTKTERPRLHKVILVNDDFTPREFVVTVLKAEFRMTEDHAHKVMITAHRRGVCVVAVFTKDVAETKATRATDAGRAKGYPLLFTTEPEE
jgi:ATP-dependent Clp protease adaptor protein ClpS